MTKTKVYTYDYLELNGRLGNQLFQIAATEGIARANGGIAWFKPHWEYRPYFRVPDSAFTRPNDWQDHRKYEVIDGGTQYFQELHYFQHIEETIKEWFLPSVRSIELMLSDYNYSKFLTLSGKPTCSIHVRRGDYLYYPEHFPIPTVDYYKRAIDKVLGWEPDTKFYVFSDDIEWCHKNFGDPCMTYIDGVARPVEVADRVRAGEPRDFLDMFAMSMCKHHIMANSTFSWWGAYLSDDPKVIYPGRWFGTHPAVRDIPWRKMIPKTWEEVPV